MKYLFWKEDHLKWELNPPSLVLVRPKGFMVEIYRPGFFTAKMLEKILQDHHIDAEVRYAQSPAAPGQLKHHYMPKIPLIIVPEEFNWDENRFLIENELKQKFSTPVHWQLNQDPRTPVVNFMKR